MGARQSKRSVDITTTPKKDGLPAEGSVAGDAAAPGDGKLERIEEADGKPTTNGTAPHADVVVDEKDKDKEQEKEKEKEQENENENEKEKEKDKDEDNEKEDDAKVEDAKPESNTEAPAEAEEVTTPTDGVTPTSPENATSPESKDSKKKDKKKKWFRSLSFGKKDRSKTTRDDAPKNGDLSKEEPLAESSEEAEAAVPVEESPAEEKTAVSSPTVESTPAPAPVKEEEKAAPASPTPVEEKKEEPTPAPTPVPVEEKKEEIEKVEPVVAEKVEVSPVQAISPVGVTQAQPITTPSIIERKTSEDLPPVLPCSPPPTPIDPSPLQQAQHTAANASALAEALKVPAEAASMASQIAIEPVETAHSLDEIKTKVVTESESIIEPKITSESISMTVTELVTPVIDNIKDVEEASTVPETLKECEIVAEVVKSLESVPNLQPETILSQVESQTVLEVLNTNDSIAEDIHNLPQFDEKAQVKVSVVTESQEIITNGVSGQDSESLENIVSLAKGAAVTETIESLITQKEDEVCKKRDLVINSEEGPIPLSEESLVEAKPAFVVPEDDFVGSIIKAVETIDLEALSDLQKVEEKSKTIDVVLEADKISVNQSDSNTAVLLDAGLVELGKPEIKSSEITSIYASEIQSEPIISAKSESFDDVVPPLPESPIPSFEKSQGIGELLSEKIDDSSDVIINLQNGSSISCKTNHLSGHLDSEIVFDPIEELRACHMSAEGLLSPAKESLPELSSSVTEVLNVSTTSPLLEKLPNPTNDILPDFPSSPLPPKDISSLLDDLPVPPTTDIIATSEEVLICPLPTKDTFKPANDGSDAKISSESVFQNGSPVEEPLTPIDPLSPKTLKETLVSPPCNPSPENLVISPKESSQLQLIDDQSNQEFEVESLSQSLNSYNDSDVQLKERLAESEGMNGVENATSCPLLKAVPTAVPDNAQIIAEPEAPAENPAENPAEISTTESVIEAPASPAPPVPAELPVLPPSEPAITEDVASVTKAIEETDISEKAVAAAVNEAIESANTNEIVTDSHHQQVINE